MRSPFRFLTWTVAIGLLVPGASAVAQSRWTVEGNTSLAWWQVDPNLNHLWSTTCPADPSWRPGQGRSAGWSINPALEGPKTGYANVSDTIDMPLYPRTRVRPLCEDAVSGEITVTDPARWRGVSGTIKVRAEALVTGETMRDALMHQALNTQSYPNIVFMLDSVVNVTHHGDTLVGTGVGIMSARGQQVPVMAELRGWPYGSKMRVRAKWHITPDQLETITPELHTLGLGLNTKLWKSFWMGADVILDPESGAAK